MNMRISAQFSSRKDKILQNPSLSLYYFFREIYRYTNVHTFLCFLHFLRKETEHYQGEKKNPKKKKENEKEKDILQGGT